MTPEQALQILDTVTAQVSLPRASHAQIQEAIAVLLKLIKQQK